MAKLSYMIIAIQCGCNLAFDGWGNTETKDETPGLIEDKFFHVSLRNVNSA